MAYNPSMGALIIDGPGWWAFFAPSLFEMGIDGGLPMKATREMAIRQAAVLLDCEPSELAIRDRLQQMAGGIGYRFLIADAFNEEVA